MATAIVVTNNSDSEFTDRYNGVDYVFPVGKQVPMDQDAARHIFGFGEADKTPTLTRLGWMRSLGDYDGAMARLGRFSFSTFDPFAQFREPAEQTGDTAQQLSPVASETSGVTASDGTDTPEESTPPLGGGVLDKLKGAVAG